MSSFLTTSTPPASGEAIAPLGVDYQRGNRSGMNDHQTALVPLWAWCFSAPDLADRGQRTDVGLLADALLYYDRVALVVPDFAGLLAWLTEHAVLSDFFALVREGTILIYDYAFFTAASYAGQGESAFSVLNFQDPVMERQGTFEEEI